MRDEDLALLLAFTFFYVIIFLPCPLCILQVSFHMPTAGWLTSDTSKQLNSHNGFRIAPDRDKLKRKTKRWRRIDADEVPARQEEVALTQLHILRNHFPLFCISTSAVCFNYTVLVGWMCISIKSTRTNTFILVNHLVVFRPWLIVFWLSWRQGQHTYSNGLDLKGSLNNFLCSWKKDIAQPSVFPRGVLFFFLQGF